MLRQKGRNGAPEVTQGAPATPAEVPLSSNQDSEEPETRPLGSSVLLVALVTLLASMYGTMLRSRSPRAKWTQRLEQQLQQQLPQSLTVLEFEPTVAAVPVPVGGTA